MRSARTGRSQGFRSRRRQSCLSRLQLHRGTNSSLLWFRSVILNRRCRARCECLPFRQSVQLQRVARPLAGNVARRVSLIANYTFSKAQTGAACSGVVRLRQWSVQSAGPVWAGDYGPSGEDVRQRAVFAGTWHAPGKVDVSTLTQAESARRSPSHGRQRRRISINGVPSVLDQFRGTPYIQAISG